MIPDARTLVAALDAKFAKEALCYACKKLGSIHDARDVLQEVYTSILRQDPASIENPDRYFWTAVRNAVTRFKTRRNAEFSRQITLDSDAVPDQWTNHTLAAEPSAIDKWLHDAVRALPPKCRTVSLLFYVYGFSREEIGKQLNISTRMVSKYLEQARKRLLADFCGSQVRVP